MEDWDCLPTNCGEREGACIRRSTKLRDTQELQSPDGSLCARCDPKLAGCRNRNEFRRWMPNDRPRKIQERRFCLATRRTLSRARAPCEWRAVHRQVPPDGESAGQAGTSPQTLQCPWHSKSSPSGGLRDCWQGIRSCRQEKQSRLALASVLSTGHTA